MERERGEQYQQPPTHLRLFRYSPEVLAGSRELVGNLEFFQSARARNINHWRTEQVQSFGAIERLDDAWVDTSEAFFSLTRSVTAGKAYLAIHEEFVAQGLSEHEIFDFYLQCFQINSMVAMERDKASSPEMRALWTGSDDFYDQKMIPYIHRSVFRGVPSWFRGTEEQYINAIIDHSHFAMVIDSSYKTLTPSQEVAYEKNFAEVLTTGDVENLFAYAWVSSSDAPDWLHESKGNAPLLEDVEKELEEDREEELVLRNEISRLNRARVFLRDGYEQSVSKAKAWLDQTYDNLILQEGKEYTFGEMFLHINAIPDSLTHFLDSVTDPNARLESDEDIMALWIERNLRLAGIQQDGTFSPEGRQTLQAFLRTCGQDAREEDSAQFRSEFEQQNKKGFRALHYDLRPFYTFLSSQDRQSLVSLLEEYTEPDLDPVIAFMADAAVASLKGKQQDTYGQPLQKAQKEYAHFVRQFIRNHWQWAAAEYKRILFSDQKDEQTTQEQRPSLVSPEDQELTAVLDKNIEEAVTSPLSTWEVGYALDKDTDQHDVLILSGKTLEDLSAALKGLKRDKHIVSSIKDESVIRALERKVKTPREVEYFAYRKRVGEVVWKKIKRGAVRIFYRIDPNSEKITFFLHQKKDLSYGF